MSILFLLLCLAIASPLKVPQKRKQDESDSDESTDSAHSTGSPEFQFRFADDNGGGAHDPLDPYYDEVFVNPAIAGPSHGLYRPIRHFIIYHHPIANSYTSSSSSSEGNYELIDPIDDSLPDMEIDSKSGVSSKTDENENVRNENELAGTSQNVGDELTSSISTMSNVGSDYEATINNLNDPPFVLTATNSINFIEDHFKDRNSKPMIPIIVITPPDNDPILDESASSRDTLNTTSSTNITSGYLSMSLGDIQIEIDHTPNSTIDSSTEENIELENKPGEITRTVLHFEDSPFESLMRFARRRKMADSIKKVKTERAKLSIQKAKWRKAVEKNDSRSLNDESESNHDPIIKKREANKDDVCTKSVDELSERFKKYRVDAMESIWHSSKCDDRDCNRHELRITEVTSENSIELDRDIDEWISLENHAVGRGSHGLTILTSDSRGIYVEHIEMQDHLSAICLFQWRNPDSSTKNVGLIIAQDTNLIWYQLHDNQLTQMWSWSLTEPVEEVKIYQIDGEWKLAVSNEESYNSDCAISIYGMNLWQNFWFEQRLIGCYSLTVANAGRYIMAVGIDHTTVFVHRLHQNLYMNVQNISSPGVQHLSAFTAGPYSFLAIGGASSSIYQLRGNDMVKEILDDYLLDHVDSWLPVNVGYYRNDLILLVQHRLHHDSHYSNAIEALYWNGERFILMEHAPCISDHHEMYGFICMTDAENERGILGASILTTIEGNVFVIMASHEFTPSMFEIKTDMVHQPDPTVDKIESIQNYFNILKEKLLTQLKVFEDIKKVYTHREQPRQIDGLMSTDDIKIKEINTPAIHLRGNLKDFVKMKENINIAGKNIKDIDLELDLKYIFDKIQTNHLRIKKLSQKVEKASSLKDGFPRSITNMKMTGRLLNKGKTVILNSNVEYINNVNLNNVLKQSFRKPINRILHLTGSHKVRTLQVNNIDIEIVNGVNLLDPMNSRDPITIYGDLNMKNHVEINGKIRMFERGKLNNIDLKRDVFTVGKRSKENSLLNFQHIETNKLLVKGFINGFPFTRQELKDAIQNSSPNQQFFDESSVNLLTVGNNLHFETVNGVRWSDFIERVIFKSESQIIDNLRVDGQVTVDKNLSINFLNTLRYPQDYFMTNEAGAVYVSGAKIFESEFRVGEVDCAETVNGVQPDKIVTLSTNQKLDNFTFYNLTITERIDVQGNINGKGLDGFLSNPLLMEKNNVKSKVIFKHLTVEGNILTENKINGTNWKDMSEGLIEKSDPLLIIDSNKIFLGSVTVENGLNVQSGVLNERKINDILTVDTNQDIFTENLNGKVIFDNIEIEGTFDEINIKDIVENSIDITKNQTVWSEIIFEDDIFVKDLVVTESVNNWNINDLVYKDNLVLNSPQFNSLHVENFILEGDIEKSWAISGVNLYNFDRLRMSKSMNQEISVPMNIRNCRIDDLYFRYLNDKTNNEIYTNLRKIADFENDILQGHLVIRNLKIKENFNVNNVNNINLQELYENAVFLNKENVITAPITFEDSIHFNSLHINGKSFDKNFDEFLNDIVRKFDKNVTFTGKKNFTGKVTVKNKISTRILNHIQKTRILTTRTNQNLKGTMRILGNVTSLRNIHGTNFNGIDIIKLNGFEHLGNNSYALKGNFKIEDGSSIHDLCIKGLINNLYNPENVLKNVVYLSENNSFSNTVTFNNSVFMENGIDLEGMFNDVDIKTLFNDVVFLNHNSTPVEIGSTVAFNRELQVDGTLTVDENVEGELMNGINLRKLEREVVNTKNHQEIKGLKNFHNAIFKNDIIVDYINNISTKEFIPLVKPKDVSNIDEDTVKIENLLVDNMVVVRGRVNGVNLEKEMENHLMKVGNQIIESPLYFTSNVTVVNNLNIEKANGKFIDKIVTLDEDQILTGNYKFHGKTTFKNGLNITGTATDQSFKKWLEKNSKTSFKQLNYSVNMKDS